MAKYQVVEVTHLNCGLGTEGGVELEGFNSVLSNLCPAGWQIVSTRVLADNGIQRALILMTQ